LSLSRGRREKVGIIPAVPSGGIIKTVNKEFMD
jgi:hypothetical protein